MEILISLSQQLNLISEKWWRGELDMSSQEYSAVTESISHIRSMNQ